MENILEKIYQHKLVEVRERKKILPVPDICARIKCSENRSKNFYRDFFGVLKTRDEKAEISLICEIKKASLSHGIIRADFNHIDIARAYIEGGAACISILTDEKYFHGKNEYLQEVRAITNLPILCKDFVIDTYQIYEAKMLGADCILLIVAMLDDAKLAELEKCALDVGLSVLIEIHNEEELQRGLKLKSKLLGINNRDLKTLKVDLQTSLFLCEQVPNGYVLVSESGIKDALDVELLQQAGINCFLIGEHFMRQKDIVKSVKDIQLLETSL